MSASIGILGAGHIGGTLAKLLDDASYRVHLANSRGPDTLRELVSKLGPNARAATIDEAIAETEMVIEAVPFGRVHELPAAALEGKILVSASNYYPARDGEIELGDLSQTAFVARMFPGAAVVKAFNTIYWEQLRDQGDPALPLELRRVIPIAGDDPHALDQVSDLVEALGFGPLRTGTFADTIGLTEPGGSLYNLDMTLVEATRRLESARE